MDKFMYCVIEFISSIFGMIILTLSLISLREYHFNSNMIDSYKENWGKGPIMNIIVPTENQGCPISYEPFITDSFPGLSHGCDCYKSPSLSFNQKVFIENCTSDQLQAKCSPITQTFNQRLSNWQGINLCVKRLSANFYLLNTHIAFNTCPLGKESCGLFDSIGNVYCVDKGQKCPINYLEILSKNNQPSMKDINSKEIQSIPLKNDYTLYYSTKANDNGRLLINLRTNTHKMCYEPNEGMFGQNNFTLNQLQGYNTCITSSPEGTLYDDRYRLVDSQNLITFYKENNIDSKSPKLISTFLKEITPTLINLYSTNYYGWHPTCYKHTKDLFTLDNLIWPNTTNNYSMIYLIGIIAVIYYIFIIAMFALILMLEDSKQKDCFWTIVAVFEISLLISMLGLAVTVIYNTSILLEPYKEFKNMNCAEDITLHAFDLAYGKLLKVYNYLIPFTTFTLFDIVARVAYYAHVFFIKHSK